MKIIRKENNRVEFKDVQIGEIFTIDNVAIYIKTDTKKLAETNIVGFSKINCVELSYGRYDYVPDDCVVTLLKDSELVI